MITLTEEAQLKESMEENNTVGCGLHFFPDNNENQTVQKMSLKPFKKLSKEEPKEFELKLSKSPEWSHDLVDLYLTDAVKAIITEGINHETFNASEYAQMDGNEIKVNITFNISMSMDDLVNSKNVK